MLLTSFIAPSATLTMDMPSFALRMAWCSERTSARRFSEIPSPAASSAALLMR